MKRNARKLLALLAAVFMLCTAAAGCSDVSPAELASALAAVSWAPLPSEAFPAETPAPVETPPEPSAGPAEPVLTPEPVPDPEPADAFVPGSSVHSINFAEVPPFAGAPYVPVHGNTPYFDPREISKAASEHYSPRDILGRCGTAWGIIGPELMPEGDRGDLSEMEPSGWNQAEFDGGWLYHRCHLIGYQLAGENANADNLITGTTFLNLQGMLPFENQVADYIRETGNHVLYRATPYFLGDDLVCRGVLLEGLSVEDAGEDICFCVFAYNVQPGVEINYADGSSSVHQPAEPDPGPVLPAEPDPVPTLQPTPEAPQTPEPAVPPVSAPYIGNKNTGKFHVSSCGEIKKMKESNKVPLYSRDEALAGGYVGCKRCQP